MLAKILLRRVGTGAVCHFPHLRYCAAASLLPALLRHSTQSWQMAAFRIITSSRQRLFRGRKADGIKNLFVVSRQCRSDLGAFDLRKLEDDGPNRNCFFDKQFSEGFGCVGAAILQVGNKKKRPFLRSTASSRRRTYGDRPNRSAAYRSVMASASTILAICRS